MNTIVFLTVAAMSLATTAENLRTNCAAGANLAVNGDFESGTNGWKSIPADYVVEAGTGRNGSAALKYSSSATNGSGLARLYLDLKPGRLYRYGVWVKTALRKRATSGASVCIEWNGEKGKHLGGAYTRGISGSNDWMKIDAITPRIPENARSFRISPTAPRDFGGDVWFDDITVTEYKVPPVGHLAASAYRNMAADGDIRLCVALELPECDYPSLSGLCARFFREGIDGARHEVAASVFTRDRAECEISVQDLPMGDSRLGFSLTDSSGKEIGAAETGFVRADRMPRWHVSFDNFNRTLVNGEPFFPLGMYWANPITEEDMSIYANGPFNALMPYHPHTDKSMEICKKHGMMTCSVVRRGTPRYPPEKVLEYINLYKNSPCLLAWYINDEAPLTRLDELTSFRKFLAELDPHHPTWAVEDKCSLIRAFMPSFDVIGTDPYPIPMRPLSMAGDWTRETREGSYGIRPIWQVPQTFDWAAYRKMPENKARAPTAAEISTMTWLCIAEGANGIFFYSFHDLKKGTRGATFEERWNVVCVAAREVKERFPILLAEPAKAPEVPAGVSARAWMLDGVTHTLVVNGTTEHKTFTIPRHNTEISLKRGEHKFLQSDAR